MNKNKPEVSALGHMDLNYNRISELHLLEVVDRNDKAGRPRDWRYKEWGRLFDRRDARFDSGK